MKMPDPIDIILNIIAKIKYANFLSIKKYIINKRIDTIVVITKI